MKAISRWTGTMPLVSCTLAGAASTASGMPYFSTARWGASSNSAKIYGSILYAILTPEIDAAGSGARAGVRLRPVPAHDAVDEIDTAGHDVTALERPDMGDGNQSCVRFTQGAARLLQGVFDGQQTLKRRPSRPFRHPYL